MYRHDKPGLRRILLLGDSISRGITLETIKMYGKLANIHEAPRNCLGAEQYNEANLAKWLGTCKWDLIQFQIGAHVKEDEGLRTYAKHLRNVVTNLKRMAPSAMIVFAATTPTPFDTKETRPSRSTCKNYDKFQPEGYVSKLNTIARDVMAEMKVTFNDRYHVIISGLRRYQIPCDIHFVQNGYKKLADKDWTVFSNLLKISSGRRSGS